MRGITIGIPAFNARKSLERAVDSALSQTTREPFEIIIVDDGSADTTANIGVSYELMFPEVVRVIRTANKGVAAARNVIVSNARYSHLTWLDADDFYFAHKLDVQFSALYMAYMHHRALPSNPNIMVFSPFRVDKKTYSFSPYLGDPIRNILRGDFRAYLWSSMVATEAYRQVGPFNEALHRSEDTDWLLRYLKNGERLLLGTSEDPLMQYHFSTERDGAKVEESFDYMRTSYSDDMRRLDIEAEYVPRRYWEISNFYHSNKKWNDMWRCRALAAKTGPGIYRPKLDAEIHAIADRSQRDSIEKLVRSYLR